MMNIILAAGLIILSQSLYVYSVDDLPVSSTNSKAASKFLCELFPNFLKSKCESEQSSVENNPEKSTNSIQDFPEKIIRDETLKRIDSICSVLDSPLKDACIKILSLQNQEILEKIMKSGQLEDLYKVIEDYYKEIIDSFKNIFSKENVENPLECVACQLIMKALSKILSDNPTKETIRNALAQVCRIVPTKMQHKCRNFVYKYFDQIIDFLVKKYDPSQICKKLMLCSNHLSQEHVGQQALEKIMKSDQLGELYGVIEDYYKEISNSSKKGFPQDNVENPVECVACQLIMKMLAKLLSHNPTRETIRNALAQVCRIVPTKMQDKCRNFVYKYFDQIIDFLLKKYDPSQICKKLMLCSNHLTEEHVGQQDLEKIIKSDQLGELYGVIEDYYKEISNSSENIFSGKHVGDPVGCVACQLIMKMLEKILSQNPTKETIRNALAQICRIIPNYMQDKCQDFVYKYSDQIIDFLVKKYDPSQICKRLMLCSNNVYEDVKISEMRLYGKYKFDGAIVKKYVKNKIGSEIKKNGANPVECLQSKRAMKENESIIENKKSKEIENGLRKICHILTKELKDRCEELDQKNGERIMELLLDNILAPKMCSIVQLCSIIDDPLYFLPKANHL